MKDEVLEGDVLLLVDGRMVRVVQKRTIVPLEAIQFIDRDVESYIDVNKLDIEKNLGQSTNVLMTFYTTRSLHLRLNRMNSI